MKAFRVLILVFLLAGCGWEAQQELEILKSDQNGITIKAGMATTPDRVATVYCQGMRKLMVPKGAEIISDYQKVFYYACL
jgi:hypothetical protein